MRIGLIDVDGHNFPNIAQMKIAAYHKKKGDFVTWGNSLERYDIVYMSKVFTFTDDYQSILFADQIIKGGTGYDLLNKLPDQIENIFPDYSLYNIKNTAYGFLSRGCPRGCPFCIVAHKEGFNSYKVADLKQFWNGQKYIEVCDPNILACRDKYDLLKQLVDSKAYINFNQGLDVRLIDDKSINLIKQMKLKIIHFAWDREGQSELIIKNLIEFKKQTGLNAKKIMVYVLVNYETTFDFDLYRVYKLKELGFDPYVMVYNKKTASKKIKQMQRWVNNKYVFYSGNVETFEDYLKGIGNN